MTSRSARFVPGLAPPAVAGGRLWLFAFRRRELLVREDGSLVPVESLEALGFQPLCTHFLGLFEDVPCFAAELPVEIEPPAGMAFRDLRALYGRLPPELHEVAGRAVQIAEWDRTHRFCGACGTPTEPSPQERVRVCPACGLQQFPRLAPAVIVAVERGDEILLGRSPHFPRGILSVLAGFVEPGESVEETVRREVYEESGVEVGAVRWFGSQPWPYPNSVMLGFQAEWKAGEPRCGDGELEQVEFFRADAMPPLFPGRVSIAQWLIHDFLRRHGQGPDR